MVTRSSPSPLHCSLTRGTTTVDMSTMRALPAVTLSTSALEVTIMRLAPLFSTLSTKNNHLILSSLKTFMISFITFDSFPFLYTNHISGAIPQVTSAPTHPTPTHHDTPFTSHVTTSPFYNDLVRPLVADPWAVPKDLYVPPGAPSTSKLF